MSSPPRANTHAVLDLCQGGSLSWETVARECLSYMSEADVFDMATTAEWITEEDDEEPEDAEPTEPEEGDYIIYGTRVYEFQGKRIGTFAGDWDSMAKILKARMDREQFWPNVWLQDDHGGYTLATLD